MIERAGEAVTQPTQPRADFPPPTWPRTQPAGQYDLLDDREHQRHKATPPPQPPDAVTRFEVRRNHAWLLSGGSVRDDDDAPSRVAHPSVVVDLFVVEEVTLVHWSRTTQGVTAVEHDGSVQPWHIAHWFVRPRNVPQVPGAGGSATERPTGRPQTPIAPPRQHGPSGTDVSTALDRAQQPQDRVRPEKDFVCAHEYPIGLADTLQCQSCVNGRRVAGVGLETHNLPAGMSAFNRIGTAVARVDVDNDCSIHASTLLLDGPESLAGARPVAMVNYHCGKTHRIRIA
jgi:hypothetical protein